jgi:hypothetical protein
MAHELTRMTDDAILAEAKRLAAVERRSTAELLSLMIEVERRALHLALGYSSLFAYCTRELLLSEQAADTRITAARLAKRYPDILQHLADGVLTLSSVGLLALHPQPDVPAAIRALPSTRPALLLEQDQPVESTSALAPPAPVLPAAPLRVSQPRPIIAPLAPKRYLLRVTIDAETNDKLQRLRALLRHAVPDGDLGAILARAIALLLHEAERTRWASVNKPRPSHPAANRKGHVPAVRRAVWTRDAGRCAFVGQGRRCDATAWLEFHHVVPFAAGGATDEHNLELRCRAHNQYETLIDAGVGT